jgi:hypothetical protein
MADDMPLFDLSLMTFEEFVSFFFDHDVQKEEYWYHNPALENFNDFDDEGVSSPSVVVEYMARLFTEFSAVASRFSLPQINAGIWGMFSYGGLRLQKHLWLPSAPLPQRLDCIRAMYLVYSEYVAKSAEEVMENCFDIWWDFVASSFWEQMRFTDKIEERDALSLSAEHRALLDSMFETLSKILALPDARTRVFALHGLGHLHHPKVPDLLQHFLDENRADFTPEGIDWVERCRDGTIM